MGIFVAKENAHNSYQSHATFYVQNASMAAHFMNISRVKEKRSVLCDKLLTGTSEWYALSHILLTTCIWNVLLLVDIIFLFPIILWKYGILNEIFFDQFNRQKSRRKCGTDHTQTFIVDFPSILFPFDVAFDTLNIFSSSWKKLLYTATVLSYIVFYYGQTLSIKVNPIFRQK